MDNKKLTELIMSGTMGNISKEVSSELFEAMKKEKEFPWKELGDHQNLAALLAVTITQEAPAEKVKEKILKVISEKRNNESFVVNEFEKVNKPVNDFEANEENHVNKKNNLHKSFVLKDPDLTQLNIFSDKAGFEEVHSKISKIKNQLNENLEPEIAETAVEEIIFEHHTKPAQLKKPSKKRVVFAFGAIAAIVMAVGIIYFIISGNRPDTQKKLTKNETKILLSKSRVQPDEHEIIMPADNKLEVESPDNIPQDIKTEEKVNFEPETIVEKKERPVEKEIKIKVPPPPESSELIEAPLIDPAKTQLNIEKNNTGLSQLPPEEKKTLEEEPVYFVAVEEMPEPIGGIKAIQEKIIYPGIAIKAGVQGKVLVLAFVNESGTVIKAEIIKGIGMGCDEAALDAVLKTKFKPGLQRGKPVKVQITIPVNFSIN